MQPDVLVVEDEALLLMLLRDVFEDEGLRVESASDAESALSLLTGGAARDAIDPPGCHGQDGRPAPLRPAVLVTDLNLGPGADGLSLADAARRQLPWLPVVFVTGNPDLVTARGLGPGERLVPKPFDPFALAAEVRDLARAARRGGPPTPAERCGTEGGR